MTKPLVLVCTRTRTCALNRKVVVIGSGYIAVELAGILNALGSKVSVVARYHKVLRSFDEMLSDGLMEEMASAGVEVVKFSKVRICVCVCVCACFLDCFLTCFLACTHTHTHTRKQAS